MMLPGDGDATSPAPVISAVATPAAPPQIEARISRLHEDVREVDLVDAAEEVHQDRAGHGRPQPLGPEQQVRDQHAQARAGVRLDHEQDRLARRRRLHEAQRRQDALVDRVVEDSTLAGSTMIDASGSRPLLISAFTPTPVTRVSAVTIGPPPSNPMIAMMPPMMP